MFFYLYLYFHFLLPRCGRFPPEVRTAIPVDGRFEHIVLSCHATSDHGIIWIEKEAGKALEVSIISLHFLINDSRVSRLCSRKSYGLSSLSRIRGVRKEERVFFY